MTKRNHTISLTKALALAGIASIPLTGAACTALPATPDYTAPAEKICYVVSEETNQVPIARAHGWTVDYRDDGDPAPGGAWFLNGQAVAWTPAEDAPALVCGYEINGRAAFVLPYEDEAPVAVPGGEVESAYTHDGLPVQPLGTSCHDHLKASGLLVETSPGVEQVAPAAADPARGGAARKDVCPFATAD